MGAVLGLSAALLWGIGDLLARFAGQAIGAWRTLFYSELIGLALLTIWLAAFSLQPSLVAFEHLPWHLWLLGLASGTVHLVGSYGLTRALTVGTISLVMPIASSYGAVSAALSIANGEVVSAVVLTGIVVTVIGVALAGAQKSEGHRATHRGVGWALVAAASYGVTFWAQGRYLVSPLGGLQAVWLFLVIGVAIMTSAALLGLGNLAPPPRAAYAATFGTGSLAVAAYVAVALGFATGQIAIVAVLSTLSSVVTALLGFFVLKERLARVQVVGVALILVGIFVINAG